MDKKSELKKLGKNIARLRRLKSFSQDELALEANIGRRTINRVEVGEADVRFSTLIKIADTLKVDLKELVDF